MNNKKLRLLPVVKFIIVLCTCLFSLLPFFIMFKGSFESYNSIVSLQFHLLPKNASMYNYFDLLANYEFLRWFFNSVFVAIAAIAINWHGWNIRAKKSPTPWFFLHKLFQCRQLWFRCTS